MSKEDVIKKIASMQDIFIDVKVSAVHGKDDFLGTVSMNHFNSERMVHNGGPVTIKGVNTQAIGKSHDEAYENALKKAVELMGL